MISNRERLNTRKKIRSNIPKEWEHGTINNKNNKAYSFFILLTLISQNRKGEITKKEKSLSITDLYFYI